MNETIKASIEFAMEAHQGQTDKKGIPYIEHPVRVAVAVMEETNDIRCFIVGILHDVIEDTEKTLEDIRTLLSKPGELSYVDVIEMTDALDRLTHRKNEPYKDYVRLVAQNNMARKVKLCDVKDNLNRIDGLPMETKARLLGKYIPALAVLNGSSRV